MKVICESLSCMYNSSVKVLYARISIGVMSGECTRKEIMLDLNANCRMYWKAPDVPKGTKDNDTNTDK